MLRSKLTALMLPVLSAPVLAIGGVAVFEGPPGGVGSVGVYDEQTGSRIEAPPELGGIRLIAIDFCGRTPVQELLPARPRLRDEGTSAARLALPANGGSLYRFLRPSGDGSAKFGFLHVARDGRARSVFERPGVGPLGEIDPFVASVAVAPDGGAFLVATRLPAGGDLFEVGLGDPIVVRERSASLPPQRFSPAGLALSAEAGFAAGARGVFSFLRANPGEASPVSFAPDAPAYFSGELVTSRNGAFAATTAGTAPDDVHVYVLDALGSVRRATTAPGRISGAGYLPGATDGPHLAVDDQGLRCAWRADVPLPGGGFTREAFLARTQPIAGEEPEQLTSDANFLDTLDEVGVMLFRITGELVLAIGEQGAGAIGRADLFAVSLPAGGGASGYTNLSLSSGDGTLPFTGGVPEIEMHAPRLLPDASAMVVLNESGNDGPLYLVPLAPGASAGALVLLPDVKSLDLIEVAGRHLMLSVGRGQDPKPQDLFRWSPASGLAPVLVVSAPENTQFTRSAPRRDGWVGFVTVGPTLGQWLDRVQLSNGTVQELEPAPSAFGPALGVTAQGSIAFSRGAASAPATFWVWPHQGVPVQLSAPSVPGHVLPGA